MNRLNATLLAALLTACGGAECPEPAEVAESAGDEEGAAPVAAPGAAPVLAPASPPAEVRAFADAERRVAPPGSATVALLAQGNNAFVARLEMEPGAAVPEHQDPDEEYIHVLEGSGTIWIDGEELAVTPGATIFMPAGATVRYQNGDARMVALQVFAGPGSGAKYDRWNAAEESSDEVQ